MKPELPTMAEAKALAKRLRQHLKDRGRTVTHAQALETIAHQHGFRDWNTLCAAIGQNGPDAWAPGQRVQGTYLSRPFEGTLIASQRLSPGWFRVVIDLDEPVDVVTFESFSNHRKRIRGTVGPDGHSRERTSNGLPHLTLEARVAP
ncbi:glyoxalase superfamily protein [Nitratireductor rhodophyticola]|uniref:glyoxalase superfamily protein n=1 Tax=Nitratireductor rhodophyticola TaxID=2854036 RepID=UPI00300B0ADF